MDIYHFAPPSALAKVECTQDAKRVWIARLFPQAGASPKRLSELTALFNRREDGIIAVPQSERGVHTLYVSGFTSPDALLKQLSQMDIARGTPLHEKVSKEAEAFTEQIRDASLKLAGVFYLISDAALAVSGMKSGRYKETVAGLLYSSGGLVLARYGRKDAHAQLKGLSLQLGDYFVQQGIALPEGGPVAGANAHRQSAIVEGLEKFAYTYPSQIFNTVVATCGVQLMQSGMIHQKPWDTASGSLVLGGALAGLVIPEKSGRPTLRNQEDNARQTPQGAFAKAYDWAQEKPLRIPGYLWFGNNAAMVVSAIRERQVNPEQKSYMFKFAYAAAAVIANGLMSISSKADGRHFDAEAEETQALFAVAASVIAAQPRPVQDQVIEQVAGFLAARPEVKLPANALAAAIRAEVAELSANPFTPHMLKNPAHAPDAARSHLVQPRSRESWQSSLHAAPQAMKLGAGY